MVSDNVRIARLAERVYKLQHVCEEIFETLPAGPHQAKIQQIFLDIARDERYYTEAEEDDDDE